MTKPHDNKITSNPHRLVYNRWVICLALIVVVATALCISFSQVLTGDDLAYCFRLDNPAHDPGTFLYGLDPTAQPIETFSDVLNSQAFHYTHWHGRSLVTGIEQFFSGVSTPQVYYVINMVVLVATMFMTIHLALGSRFRWSLWVWAATLAFFLFGTPGDADLFLSINLSCNYLLPTIMTLTVLLLWQKNKDVAMCGYKWSLVGLLFVGIICGWSHEGVCIPLSAMLFCYYLFNRKEWKTRGFILTVGYWIGTLIVVGAPGNLVRSSSRMAYNTAGDMALRVLEMFRSLMFSNLLWVFVVILILLAIFNRKVLVKFCKDNRYWVVFFVCAAIIDMLFYFEARTYFFVDFFLFVMMLRLATMLIDNERLIYQRIVPTCLIAALCGAYIVIGRYQIITNRQVQATIEEYLTSPDGLAVAEDLVYPDWLSPFIKNRQGEVQLYVAILLKKSETNWIKRVSPLEMECLKDGSLFDPKYRIGTSQFYTVPDGYLYWSRDTVVAEERHQFIVEPPSIHDKVSPFRKISRIFNFSDLHPKGYEIIGQFLVHTRYGTYVVIFPFKERKVIDIQPLNH